MAERPGDRAWEAALDGPAHLLEGRSPSFTSRLDRWVSEARVDQAALQRSRERWLREVAEQEATLSGVLADLAERRTAVGVHTRGGRRHNGVIRVIGADFVALGLPSGGDVLIAVRAIGVVRTAPAVEAAVGDRMLGTDLRLADVLAELAADRERVLLVTADGGDAVSGQLRSVGQDVVVVRTDAERPATAYVPLAAVGEVSIG
ncbi:MAG: hypothetical protein ACOYXM_16095 [Actinomycetota bacterium]